MTKVILTVCAVLQFAAGLMLDFAPQETAKSLGMNSAPQSALALQVLAAALLGFGLLNWFSRGNMMGGVYGRPLALANFLFFFVAAVPMVRMALSGQVAVPLRIAAGVMTLFAIAFLWIVFFHDPLKREAGAPR